MALGLRLSHAAATAVSFPGQPSSNAKRASQGKGDAHAEE